MRSRRLRSAHPIDLPLTLGRVRRGAGDPTMWIGPGEVWRASRTPNGPATVRLWLDGDAVEVAAWGPGADVALEQAPALAGLDDDPRGLTPAHPLVDRLHRRFRGLRMARTGAVVDVLVPTVLEQKVAGEEARRSYRALVRALGEPAPGPAPLLVPPAAETLAATPYHAFHRFGVERRRADVIRSACARASRLEEATEMPPDDARKRLTALPGVGAWTAAEVAAVAFGDPDAVSVGDYHLPHLVAWALAGEPRGDDRRMLELLEPYRGHRGRVLRLLELGAPRPQRFAPRRRLRAIERM